MAHGERFTQWFERHWPQATVPVAIALLILLPVVFSGLSAATFFAVLFVPLALLHQYEEHAGGRVKTFMHRLTGPARPVPTRRAALLVAAMGVWLPGFATPILTTFSTGGFVAIAWAISATEVVLHLAGSAVTGRPSPGVRTALVLLLPFSVFAFGAAQTAGAVEGHYVVALVVAVAPRAAAALVVLGRRRLVPHAA
ncbi:MAG: HXXEE domain-containing protein [Spirochaetota bacterium]